MKTFYYKTKLSATSTQQTLALPVLRGFSVINNGPYDVALEFENDIDASSVILMVGSQLQFKIGFLDMRYKTINAEETATLYVAGLRQEKV